MSLDQKKKNVQDNQQYKESFIMLAGNIIEDRLNQVKNNSFFQEELKWMKRNNDIEYYQHIIDNIEIDNKNQNNSYIMWVFGKVDKIDLESPPKFVSTPSALPDIDIDVPPNKREILIQYLRDKYGKASVAQIITFGTLKGKNVLKEVLRNSGACDFVTANTITKYIPQEAKIIDLMKKDDEKSIVHWVLKNQPKVFDGYCKLTEEGDYVGEYAKYFEQAVRLEGIIKSVGVHAAGIIITKDKVDDYFPLFKHDSGEMIAAMEYPNLEAMSGCKIDLLGVAALQKLDDINHMLIGSK